VRLCTLTGHSGQDESRRFNDFFLYLIGQKSVKLCPHVVLMKFGTFLVRRYRAKLPRSPDDRYRAESPRKRDGQTVCADGVKLRSPTLRSGAVKKEPPPSWWGLEESGLIKLPVAS